MKMGLTATALVAVITVAFIIGFYQGQLLAVQQEVKYPHMVNFVVRRDGEVIYNYTVHNILTVIGARHARNVYGFDNETLIQVKYISLSSDTSPSATWTILPNELTGGLARATGTPSVVNGTAFQVVASWTSDQTATIRCTGLHYNSTSLSDNNLWAVATIPDASVISGDDIQVTWTINTPYG